MRRGLSRRMVALICSSLGVASLSFSGNALASSSERSRAVAVGGTWGDAQEVPGTSRLNTGVEAAVEALSCGSPGNCAAGGYYADKAGQVHGFLDVELNGTWRAAQQVPGLAAIGQGSSEITAISCGGQGNCMAVGWTYTRSNQIPSLAFAVSYSNGRWHDAVAIRGSITFGGAECGGSVDLVPVCRELRGRRFLPRPGRPCAGLRRPRGQRGLASGDRGPGHSEPEQGRVRTSELRVLCFATQLRGRRLLP